MQYQAGWRRFFAIVIDSIILGIVGVIISKATGGTSASGGSASVSLSGGAFWVTLLIFFLYFTVLEGLFGQTLGKMATGIKVTNQDGEPLGWGGAIIRNVLRFVDALPFAYILGAIVMWATPKKQRIGDLAASSVVVPKDATVAVGTLTA